MEEVHKAVLKRKRVHDDKIIPVHDKIRDHNITPILVQILNDSSELNMVIGTAGDVDHDCWGYENSGGGIEEEALDRSQTKGS